MEKSSVRDLSGGVNQSGVRAHNERLMLSILQRHGPLPGSEIAKRTGLSPQTASVILRKLESDGLLTRGESVKGKVGKPSVPMDINPSGLFSYGLKIGRRSADLLLMDFKGKIQKQQVLRYAYPMPDTVFTFLQDGIKAIERGFDPLHRARICGIGIATPFELWNWHELVGAPAGDFLTWKSTDFAEEVGRFSDLPVFVVNDATAACRAEHMFGHGKGFRDYAYFFLGAFVGGGVALNHSVFEGHQGNAGALGSLPSLGRDGSRKQLLDTASIHILETELAKAGLDPRLLWQQPQDWSALSRLVDPWVERSAEALAEASLAAYAVIDFEAILIDGAMPADVRDKLVTQARERIQGLDSRGVILPTIAAGHIGGNARAIGAASGPVISQFLLNTNAAFADT